MNKRIWFAVSVLLLAALACSFGGSDNGATDTTGPSDTTNTEVDSSILFSDDFSSTGSGWDRTSSSFGDTDYQDGGYHIFVSDEYSSVWANPGRNFTDVRVEVNGHKIGGVDDNEFGAICRYQDESNFYAGSISSDGYYAIIMIRDGEFGYLGADAMMPSDAIRQGSSTNAIRLDCVGSTLTLYANGTQLVSVSDTNFASGDVGLYAGTFGTPGIDILFDDFVVRRP